MEDSHSMSPWFGSIYIFIILAPVLALAVIYGGTKLMTYLEKRESEKPKGRSENSEDR